MHAVFPDKFEITRSLSSDITPWHERKLHSYRLGQHLGICSCGGNVLVVLAGRGHDGQRVL